VVGVGGGVWGGGGAEIFIWGGGVDLLGVGGGFLWGFLGGGFPQKGSRGGFLMFFCGGGLGRGGVCLGDEGLWGGVWNGFFLGRVCWCGWGGMGDGGCSAGFGG